MSCFCDKLNDELCVLIEKEILLKNEMREIQDLYIKKNEEKQELENQINYKKSQLLMIEDWSKLNLEDRRSIIYKLSK